MHCRLCLVEGGSACRGRASPRTTWSFECMFVWFYDKMTMNHGTHDDFFKTELFSWWYICIKSDLYYSEVNRNSLLINRNSSASAFEKVITTSCLMMGVSKEHWYKLFHLYFLFNFLRLYFPAVFLPQNTDGGLSSPTGRFCPCQGHHDCQRSSSSWLPSWHARDTMIIIIPAKDTMIVARDHRHHYKTHTRNMIWLCCSA